MADIKKTIVLGMGNPILSDDSVGIRVVRELEGKLDPAKYTIVEASLGGLRLMEAIAGYDSAVIVDAIQTVDGVPGTIYRLTEADFNQTRYATNPHDVNFATAIELGSKVGLKMPQDYSIFAIEVEEILTFSEQCTPAVEAAIPQAVEMVLEELNHKSG
jgi:hydrogenase maturation protease